MATTVIEFLDNDGIRHQYTFKQCEKYMENIGMGENNKAQSIAHRYRKRKEKGWSNRQCLGLCDRPEVRRGATKKYDTLVSNTVMTRFLRQRLSDIEWCSLGVAGWGR